MGVVGEGKKRGRRKLLMEEAWSGARVFITKFEIHRTNQAQH